MRLDETHRTSVAGDSGLTSSRSDLRAPALSGADLNRLSRLAREYSVLPPRLRMKLKACQLNEEIEPLNQAAKVLLVAADRLLNVKADAFPRYVDAASAFDEQVEHLYERLAARQRGEWPNPRDAQLASEFGGVGGCAVTLEGFVKAMAHFQPGR